MYGISLKKKHLLNSRAILLTNALRKWGVLPSDEKLCEMDKKLFKKWHHQIADFTFSAMAN